MSDDNKTIYQSLSDGIGFTQFLIVLVLCQSCLNCQHLQCVKSEVKQIQDDCKR